MSEVQMVSKSIDPSSLQKIIPKRVDPSGMRRARVDPADPGQYLFSFWDHKPINTGLTESNSMHERNIAAAPIIEATC